jgi:hypothetical protein
MIVGKHNKKKIEGSTQQTVHHHHEHRVHESTESISHHTIVEHHHEMSESQFEDGCKTFIHNMKHSSSDEEYDQYFHQYETYINEYAAHHPNCKYPSVPAFIPPHHQVFRDMSESNFESRCHKFIHYMKESSSEEEYNHYFQEYETFVNNYAAHHPKCHFPSVPAYTPHHDQSTTNHITHVDVSETEFEQNCQVFIHNMKHSSSEAEYDQYFKQYESYINQYAANHPNCHFPSVPAFTPHNMGSTSHTITVADNDEDFSSGCSQYVNQMRHCHTQEEYNSVFQNYEAYVQEYAKTHPGCSFPAAPAFIQQ